MPSKCIVKDENNWFNNNLLNLNFTKTHYLEFRPSKHHTPNLQIHHNHKYMWRHRCATLSNQIARSSVWRLTNQKRSSMANHTLESNCQSVGRKPVQRSSLMTTGSRATYVLYRQSAQDHPSSSASSIRVNTRLALIIVTLYSRSVISEQCLF